MSRLFWEMTVLEKMRHFLLEFIHIGKTAALPQPQKKLAAAYFFTAAPLS